ncbi:MAG: hypothetical protein HYY16_02110, partial [Planctomycetes bacterium]|nr:hypothetical protein [Planctomycetota bacterium]
MNTLLLLLFVQAPPSAEITSVSPDGKVIEVNLGRDSGLKVGDGLNIFAAPEIVVLPGTKKAAFATEREIGSATIVDVLERHLIAQISGASEPVLKGCRAVPGKAVQRGPFPPYVREVVKLTPTAPFWGRVVVIDLDVSDFDGDLARVECSVDGGLLLENVTFKPQLRWMPPAQKKQVNLRVRAVDRQGLSHDRTLVLQSKGIPASAKPAGFAVDAVFGSPFLHALDLAADVEGNLYVLDDELRRVVKLTPAGETAWVSDEYGHNLQFNRMIVNGSDALLADTLGRRVLRFALGRSMFSNGPSVVYGGDRKAAGTLRKPIDLAVAPDGVLWVLDMLAGTIKTFSPDGSYVTTLGAFEQPIALRFDRQGAAHVLDARARQICTFEGTRLTAKTAVAEEGVPADLEPPLLLFPDRLGSESLNHAVALRRDAFDRVYAIVEEGQAVVRFDAAGKPAYRLGGVDLSSAKRVRALPEG